jgi:hypothetical protein
MLIPTAGASTGSSPDFASGPILQNDLFPLRVDHVLMRGSTTIFNVTRFTTLPGTWPYDGYSHVPGLGNGSATSLGLSSPLGDYLYVRTIRDSAGNGWRSRITARVVPDSAIPEPGTLALLLSGIAPLAAVWKLRR